MDNKKEMEKLRNEMIISFEIEEYQEALDGLNYLLLNQVDIKSDGTIYKEYSKNNRMLQDLIDLRKPKQVKKYGIPTSPITDKIVGLCTNCGKDKIEEGSSFCPNCGQRLKW